MGQSSGIYTPYFRLNLTRNTTLSTEGANLPVHPLIIGQKIAAGSAADGSIHRVTTLGDVEALTGKGSYLYNVAKAYFKKRSTTEVSIGVLADAGGSTAATRVVTISGTPTGSGTLAFAVMGERMSVPTVSTDSATTIAAKIVAKIGEDTGRYVTAQNTAGAITLTANNKGVGMSGITFTIDPIVGVDRLPAGLTVTIAAETPGTGTPTLTTLFDNIGSKHFYAIFSPYSDSQSIGAAKTKMDTLGSPDVARDGIYISYLKDDTKQNNISLATATASKYIAIVDTYKWQDGIPTIMGTMAREVSISVKADVNKPLHNLVLPDLVGPKSGENRVWEDRNELARYGVVGLDPEKLTLETPVTTFTATPEERRWENIWNLADLRVSFVNRILTKYARAKIRKGDERVSPGQQIITPTIAKAEAVAWYAEKIFAGQVEDAEAFSDQVVITLEDIDTMNFYLPVQIVGQFVVGTGTISYILSGGN